MKKKSRYRSAIFGLLFLIIPSINIVDVFPDFIAYFIIAGILAYGVEKVPYFEEARSAFIKLGIIGLLRLPAMLLMGWIRIENQSDTDIFALMTLIFGIIETLYLIPAISSLFDALFYLGQRSDAEATITPIKSWGNKTDISTVKSTTVFFAITRSVLALIPEFCLMTAEAQDGTNMIVHPYSRLYPLVLTPCFLLSLIIAIIWFGMIAKYIRAIGKEGRFYTAIDSMVTEERRPEVDRRLRLKKMCMALNTMVIAAFFTLEINLDNFGNVNILPHFIFAIILTCGLCSLIKKSTYSTVASIICVLYSAVSLIAHGKLIGFLNEWSYTDIKRVNEAKAAYTPVVLLSAIEFVLVAALLVTVMIALISFCKNNTKIPPSDKNYGIPDKEFHRSLLYKNILYTAFGILAALSKLVQVLLNSGADYLDLENASGSVSSIVTTAIPWFGLLMTVLSLLYGGYALHFLGTLKDELKMKYQ